MKDEDLQGDPPTGVLHLTQENFDAVISEPAPPVLVDLWAPWCGPCLMMAPILDEVSVEFEGRLRIGKLNIQDFPDFVSRFADGPTFGIPLLVLMSEGEEILRIPGACSKERLLNIVEPFLS